MSKRTIIILGIVLGFFIAVPISLRIIKWKSENRGVVVNHWRVSFRTGNFGNNYLLRSAIAVHSLGNAIPEEAMFFHGFFDHEGKKLNGNNQYIIHFEPNELPPVDAFWSVTLYNEDGYLVDNSINRYSLSDRSDGLQFNEDNSLDLYVQHKAPNEDNQSNWLPSPKTEFTLTLRAYMPKTELLNLEWKIPAITRITQ
ncbi:MAG: hypothetical protein DRJ10_04975 [Bacteroidetes bacterium]|nr:MAG: hypothetical protein DRJ10_04975 [Bacteroidota bacterium]